MILGNRPSRKFWETYKKYRVRYPLKSREAIAKLVKKDKEYLAYLKTEEYKREIASFKQESHRDFKKSMNKLIAFMRSKKPWKAKREYFSRFVSAYQGGGGLEKTVAVSEAKVQAALSRISPEAAADARWLAPGEAS